MVQASFPVEPLPPLVADADLIGAAGGDDARDDDLAPLAEALQGIETITGPQFGVGLPAEGECGLPACEVESGPAIEVESRPATETKSAPSDDAQPGSGDGASLPRQHAAAYAVEPRRSPIAVPESTASSFGPSEPTPELVAVARQADTHIANGFKLAQRGATYTARAEILHALRLTAAALDQQRQTNAHSRALAAGLRALDEAADFAPAINASGSPLSVETLTRSHRTAILHVESLDELDAPRAMQQYFHYAQEQLSAAAGDLQPGASALYALGKLEMTTAPPGIGSFESARAVVYFQAALIVNPQHALAANELGVVLARHGRLADAKAALLHSVRVAPQPAAWRNLVLVHQGLGEHQLAEQANSEWQQASQHTEAGTGAAATNVQWIDPATFARSGQFAVDPPLAASPPSINSAPPAAQTPEPSAEAESQSVSSWFPWARTKR